MRMFFAMLALGTLVAGCVSDDSPRQFHSRIIIDRTETTRLAARSTTAVTNDIPVPGPLQGAGAPGAGGSTVPANPLGSGLGATVNNLPPSTVTSGPINTRGTSGTATGGSSGAGLGGVGSGSAVQPSSPGLGPTLTNSPGSLRSPSLGAPGNPLPGSAQTNLFGPRP